MTEAERQTIFLGATCSAGAGVEGAGLEQKKYQHILPENRI